MTKEKPQLNDAQAVVAAPILATLSGKHPNIFQEVLAGYAGVGKSFVTGFIAQKLIDANHSVMAVTHSHKALAVLAASLPPTVPVKTIFSALGWRINQKSGLTDRTGRNHLSGIDVLLVDECSMVDRAMYDAIVSLSRSYNFRILWVGDPAQLPPVSETDSVPPVFAIAERQHRLTEIVRQAEDSPIIGASLYLRECLEKSVKPDLEVLQSRAGSSTDIQLVSGSTYTVADYLISAIKSGLDARAVAWTNKSVNTVNAIASRHFHPVGSKWIVANDMVTFGSAYYDKKGILLAPTDSRARVISVTPVGKRGALEMESLLVEMKTDSGNIIEGYVAEDNDAYQEHITKLVKQRSHYIRASKTAAAHNNYTKEAEYADVAIGVGALLQRCVEDTMDIRQDYALTAHKAQGSTFDAVVVDWKDMSKNPDPQMLCRLLYVALTRPRKYLVIVY